MTQNARRRGRLVFFADFGFPRYRGGLDVWADTIGVAEGYRHIPARHSN